MNLFSRHKNTVVLATVLLIQLLALGVQVKRQAAEGPLQVVRRLTVDTVAGFETLLLHTGGSVRGVWTNYLDLRGVRRENRRLKAENERMRLERASEQEEIRQAHRVQALLAFKQQWIDATVAAQVIGTSGMETSRLLYLDKGAKDGIRPDMPVITPDGIVGKVLAVFDDTAQVLMINDPSSGVGAMLVNSRLQGVVKGTPTGGIILDHIMSDESVQPGEALVTSGGDRIFPKGVPIGSVVKASPGRNLMLDIRLKPAADLNRLEEVLVITEQKPRAPDTAGLGPIRASDILAEHLPAVPQPPPSAAPASAAPSGGAGVPGAGTPKAALPGAAPAAAPKPTSPKPASPAATTGAATTGAATTAVAPKAATQKPGAVSTTPKTASPAVTSSTRKAAATPKATVPAKPVPTKPVPAKPAASPAADRAKPKTAPGAAPNLNAPTPDASSQETN